MAACGYIFFFGILPYYTPYDTILGKLHALWSCWLVFNFSFNYLMAIFTSPGISPDHVEVRRKRWRFFSARQVTRTNAHRTPSCSKSCDQRQHPTKAKVSVATAKLVRYFFASTPAANRADARVLCLFVEGKKPKPERSHHCSICNQSVFGAGGVFLGGDSRQDLLCAAFAV